MNEQASDNKNAEASIITTTLALSIGYAVLRYHIFGPVLWKDFPFVILNKGVCGEFLIKQRRAADTSLDSENASGNYLD